jgi:glycosyltransferase involved in cell wall biosynthesis
MVGLAAARLARVPLAVLTRHHTDEMFIVGSRWHVMADRLMARAADQVVGFSHAVRNHMMRREGADGSKIEVIYQGFDFDALNATAEDGRRVRAELGLGDEFVVGCVARFFKTKGHEYLLAAVRELTATIPDIRVMLLGGGDRSPIEAMIRAEGLEGRVIFTGYRNDVPACMRAMDVVIHPSLTEAFCQTVVEALAAGAPLVVTDVAAASEVVRHGENGMLVPPRDPAAIADAVRTLHRDPAATRRMADAGQRSVRERFTIDRMVSQQVACYHRWLDAGGAGALGAAGAGGS